MRFVGPHEDLPTTDEEARKWLPDWKAAQDYYTLCRERGDSIAASLETVLLAVTANARKEMETKKNG